MHMDHCHMITMKSVHSSRHSPIAVDTCAHSHRWPPNNALWWALKCTIVRWWGKWMNRDLVFIHPLQSFFSFTLLTKLVLGQTKLGQGFRLLYLAYMKRYWRKKNLNYSSFVYCGLMLATNYFNQLYCMNNLKSNRAPFHRKLLWLHLW